jgi:hypothetical protein
MVKEQVDVKGLPIDFELHLASHEGKAAAQFQQKVPKMLEELPLFGARAQGQKLERVGLLKNLLRQV